MKDSLPKDLLIQYSDLFAIFGRYWKAHGGGREVLRSPFVHLSAVLTALLSGYWLSSPWYGGAVNVIPSILGFGVAGYAIWIGWGDEKLREMLTTVEYRPGISAYIGVSAVFAHFGIIQIAALLSALVSAALDYELDPNSLLASGLKGVGLPVDAFSYLTPVGHGIGFFLFIYAILTALDTTLALFRLATWFQKSREMKRKPAVPANDEHGKSPE